MSDLLFKYADDAHPLDPKVMLATLIPWLIFNLVLFSSYVAKADACPPYSVYQPYGGPDVYGVHVTQPVGGDDDHQWAYVRLFAPDGKTYDYYHPLFGQFSSETPGQFYVCFTQDLQSTLEAAGWAVPETTSTSTTTTSTTTTTTTTTVATREPPYECRPIYTGSWKCGDPDEPWVFFWWLVQQVLGMAAWR